MSKKSRTAKQPKQHQPEPAPTAPKALTLTPQIPVGLSPNGNLFIEAPNKSGTRHKILLTAESAYGLLRSLLEEKAAEIEAERRLQAEERAKSSRRKHGQPDWELIAKHPMAEIRQGLTDASLCPKGSITVCPTKARQIQSNKSTKSLEELEL